MNAKVEEYKERRDKQDQLLIWKHFERVLLKLSADAMSSEYSTADDRERLLRVQNTPWRRDMTDMWDVIDNERSVDTRLFDPRGAKSVKRIRGLSARFNKSPSLACAGLPMSFYRVGWLQEDPRRFEEYEIDREAIFPWIQVVSV